VNITETIFMLEKIKTKHGDLRVVVPQKTDHALWLESPACNIEHTVILADGSTAGWLWNEERPRHIGRRGVKVVRL